MRALQGRELSLPTFEWATQCDPINAATIAAIAAGVSTRRYGTILDPLPAGELQSSVSRSAVSRRFVALSAEQLGQWLSRRIDAELPAVMIDGIHFQERVVLLALGFDAQGKKHVLGLWEGTTEKTAVVRALLSNLIERGLTPTRRGFGSSTAARRSGGQSWNSSAPRPSCSAARSTSEGTSSSTFPRSCMRASGAR